MDIKNFGPMPSRPCNYCLELQDSSVFADFVIDSAGHLFLKRISFDRFGCCEPEAGTGKMGMADSKRLISAIESGTLESPDVGHILRHYFIENKELLWEDALLENNLF